MNTEEWMNSVDNLPEKKAEPGKGSEHRMKPSENNLREKMIKKGFEEVQLPSFVSEKTFKSFYGDATPFFSSMHVSAHKNMLEPEEADLSKISGSLSEEEKRKIKKVIRSEDNPRKILEKLVSEAGLMLPQAVKAVEISFPSVKKSEEKLLRGSMALAWPETISVLSKKKTGSLFLFSIGRCFLPERPVFSFVVSGGTQEQGKGIVGNLFKSSEFRKPDFTDPCFVPGTEEIFLRNGEEAGRTGVIRGLEKPVFFFETDLKEAFNESFFTQFDKDWDLTDQEIVEAIKIDEKPSSTWGKLLSKKIQKTCKLYGDHKAPSEFQVFKKEVDDHELQVWVKEDKEGPLCGPAFLNEVYVHEGNVLSLPPSGGGEKSLVKKARREGVEADFNFLKAFSDMVAHEIESDPLKEQKISVKKINNPEEINIRVPDIIRRYTRDKMLNIGGKVDITVETRVKRLWTHEQP